jgi:hypothetical protein
MFESEEPKDEAFEKRIARLHLIGDTSAIALTSIFNVAIAALHAWSRQGHRAWFEFFLIASLVAYIPIAFVRLENSVAKLGQHPDRKTSQRIRENAVSLAFMANAGIMMVLSFR